MKKIDSYVPSEDKSDTLMMHSPSSMYSGSIDRMEGPLLSKILSTLDVLSLEWQGDNQLSILGELPAWAQQEFDCFGCYDGQCANAFAADDFSLFLENFIVDAKAFWEEKPSTILKSGVWTEVGKSESELYFEAIALYVCQNQRDRYILLVESATLSEEKFRWLQTAREEQLSFISERKLAATRILSATFYDSLTGLPNRKLFLSQLSGFFEDAQQEGEPFALVIINIDRFQALNDSLGTVLGDKVIATVAERLRECLRSHDVPGRFGGDEFGVLIGKTERKQDVIAIVRRLLETINAPLLMKKRPTSLTASAGIAIYDERYQKSRDLLRDAGLAMHRAKTLGKGRYALFSHEMRTHALELWNLESALRTAIIKGELQLWYQPIVDVMTQRVESFEALIRWEHSEYGWVSPAKFIPLAEESGLITEIDNWVLQTACKTIERWRRETGKTPKLNVNISSRHFSEANLFMSVRRAIASVNIPPSALRLEITESSLLTDTKTAIRTLNQLKGLGVEIAIDDFGTGYASLSYLQDLPLNKLKIDGYFVEMMGVSGSEIVETIIKLSHQLGFGVTAERVETVEEYETLRRLGCDTVQGYLFSKPLPNEEAKALVDVELESVTQQ